MEDLSTSPEIEYHVEMVYREVIMCLQLGHSKDQLSTNICLIDLVCDNAIPGTNHSVHY